MFIQDRAKFEAVAVSLMEAVNAEESLAERGMFCVSHTHILAKWDARKAYSREDVVVIFKEWLRQPHSIETYDRWAIAVDNHTGLLVFTYLPLVLPVMEPEDGEWKSDVHVQDMGA